MLTLRGAYTALITPLKEDGAIDYDGWHRLIEFQIDNGIDGLVPLGTTGENPTLEHDEEETLLKIMKETVRGRVPVVVGTGSNSTKYAVLYTKRAQERGADAALVVTPYYNKPNDSGLVRHFEAVAAVGLPVIVYNIASRCGRNISAALMKELAQIPGIIGVKESSGDIAQIGDIINETGLTLFSGDDALVVPVLALGGAGVISVISNLMPGKVAALVHAGLNGDFNEARRLHYELLPFMKAAFIETNPVPIKAAMRWAGLPAGPVRLPLGPLSRESEELLRKALAALA
ncbi:MAG: 4-hydroxy-tetrahydrodipicolinate synthase [Spirochaetaceae bacterium]|jgi:4-hydroxy-tetrahydrodipicolinate synthase|nr:4-hydroxy-tetrahydrodipicolinate synthase [Spirochaetaceae bacterium]